jgi:hypothetical protein
LVQKVHVTDIFSENHFFAFFNQKKPHFSSYVKFFEIYLNEKLAFYMIILKFVTKTMLSAVTFQIPHLQLGVKENIVL